MNSKPAKIFNKVVAVIWVGVWLNFLTQYWSFAPPLEAFLAATLLVVIAYPFTTHISGKMFRRAMASSRWGKFALEFLFYTAAYSAILYAQMVVFGYLERTGVFEGSNLFYDTSGIVWVVNVWLSAVIINLGFCGLSFLESTIRLQRELHASQLQTLNGQINPHSMFNVLNHIHVLLQKDPSAADDLLLKYSDTLRYQLYNAHKESIALGKEIEYLGQYIEVEKVRWKNKLTVCENWTVENPDNQIPPLLFIVFLENAFKFVSRSDTEKGYVNVSLNQSGRNIIFMVTNSKLLNTLQKNASESGGGIGLDNIRKRLDLLFPRRYELNIDQTEETYSVNLKLDIQR